MKKSIRTLSLLLALLMLIGCAAVLSGCNKDPENTETTTDSGTESNPAGSNGTPSGGDSAQKTQYTVSVKNIGGRGIADLTFHIYEGEDLVAYGQTDENGIGTVSLKPSNNYTVELPKKSLEGYAVEDRYSFTGVSANIVLTSSVILDPSLTGVSYKLGDIIRDFTVTDTDGNKFQLSEVLKNKKGVLINFWYSTCSPCINEFPYLQSAYEKYSDDIAVIGLNNYYSDYEDTLKNFKSSMGLTFPLAKDYSGIGNAFRVNAYPTSIFVDRYGTICLVEIGGLTSEKPLVAAFDHFRASNYQQQLFTSIGELTPVEKPNVEMPSSEEMGAAVNGAGFTATYAPEIGTNDAEYSWPFVIGSKDGASCIYPANAYKDSSFATLHVTVEMKAGEAFAIDWFADTEKGVDILYILVDGKDTYLISGTSTEWATCYPFVAVDDGTYKISFVYLKDEGDDQGEDRVYLRNFRIASASAVDTETYIPRQAATKPNANGLGFQSYITPVFNSADGYYHVGTANGPILLANLMGGTLLSDTSINDLGYTGKLIDNQGNIYEALETFCNYAINGKLYGYCPVTEELKGLLERAAELVGFEPGNTNQWLQVCSYYDAYGTNGKQLEDPVKGIAFFAAFDTVVSTETEEKLNTVEYDGRVIMPRGLKYKLVPAKSGAYIIQSQSAAQVNGWIFDKDYNIIYTAETVERPYDGQPVDTTNVTMVLYLKQGETYYIDIAYYDIYAAGTFTFTVKFIADTYEYFRLASSGYFTYTESTGGQMNETIAGGIDVALGTDGYYHEKKADGTLGSIVYADFKFSTGLFSYSILQMIEMGAFNFAYSDTDQMILTKLTELNDDVDACRNYYKELWGEGYAEWAEIWQLEEVLAGKYHGGGQNLTEAARAYVAKMLPASSTAPELEGCVKMDAGLAVILQALVDKYSLSGVDHSWTKLCYYYESIAP